VVKKGNDITNMYNSGESILVEELTSFLRENELTGLRLRLLLFWSKHPETKFNLGCIAHFLDITSVHLRDMLEELVTKGLVNEQYCSGGMAHYSLNQDHAFSTYVKQLSVMDWSTLNSLEMEINREVVLI
jgi:hypothetical protein